MSQSRLKEPVNSGQKDLCLRAQEYLSSEFDKWSLPSEVELIGNDIARVWYIYLDHWPYDDEPHFKFSLCIPAYSVWGKKKRDKYLKSLKHDQKNSHT